MHRVGIHPLKLFFLPLLSLGWQHPALGAEQRIIVLETMEAPIAKQFTRAFLQHFKELEPSTTPKIRRLNAKGELSQSQQKRSRLTEKVSELLLKQADMVQSNATVVRQLKYDHDTNQALREQMKAYAGMVAEEPALWKKDQG